MAGFEMLGNRNLNSGGHSPDGGPFKSFDAACGLPEGSLENLQNIGRVKRPRCAVQGLSVPNECKSLPHGWRDDGRSDREAIPAAVEVMKLSAPISQL